MDRRFLALLVLLPLAPGCSCIQSALQPITLKSIQGKDILEKLNTNATGENPPFASVESEVEEIFRDSLPDAYWDVSTALAPLAQPGATLKIRDAILCAEGARGGPDESKCLDGLDAALGFPAPPDNPDETAWRVELDAIRAMENLGLAVRSAASFYHSTQQPPINADADKLLRGVDAGLQGTLAYLKVRPVARHRDRPVSTMVMSGGAANGAYSAGATWFLLNRLDACRKDAELKKADCAKRSCSPKELQALQTSCLGDTLDMVAGTSTGSLITLLVKDYFVQEQNRRQRALDLLLGSYTCSVNSDLYCVVDTNLFDLVDATGKAKGLVRFDGIQRRLEGYVDETTLRSPTEYFASSVDFTTGRTFHFSSADPHDVPTQADLKRAVLASIVEPGLAEPVPQVGPVRGTFIDGGIRSGLPTVTPLLRGAERAVVLVNSPLEAVPLEKDPANGGAILLRTLDLFTKQPIVGELHEAENRLIVKRIAEYGRCTERTQKAGWSIKAPLEDLCSGKAWPVRGPAPRQVITQAPPPLLKAIPNAYQGVWLFQHNVLPKDLELLAPGTTWKSLTQAGYQFEPKAMWNLFVLGAIEAQEQCQEINRVLGWHLTDGETPGYCGDLQQLKALLAPIKANASANCWNRKNELRMCPK